MVALRSVTCKPGAMPQLLGTLAVGALAWSAYRWLRKEMQRVQTDLKDADEALKSREARSIPTLKQDPETGVYSPDRRG